MSNSSEIRKYNRVVYFIVTGENCMESLQGEKTSKLDLYLHGANSLSFIKIILLPLVNVN